MKREALRLWNINLENDGAHILKNISLTLWMGESLGIFGMNDSGISSLMKVLLHPQKLTSGKMYCLYSSGIKKNRMTEIIYIKVSNPMINSMTVWENTLVLRQHRHPVFFLSPYRMIQELNRVFQEFDIQIDPHQYVSELKTIQKLQLDIIRAYITNAKIVLMDDFSIDFTPAELLAFSQLITRMKAVGMSFIFAGHRMGNLLQLCDRISFLSNGTIIKTIGNTPACVNSIKKGINSLAMQPSFRYSTGYPGIGDPLLNIRAAGMEHFPTFSISLFRGQVTAICDTTMKVNKILNHYFENKKNFRHSRLSIIRSDFTSGDRTINALTVEDNICFRKLRQYSTFGMVKQSLVHFAGTDFLAWCKSDHIDLRGDCRSLSHTDSVALHLFSILLSHPDIIIYDDSMDDIDYNTKHMIMQALLATAHTDHCAVCVLNSDLDKLDDFADRYILITDSDINYNVSFREVQLAYENR